MEFTKRNMKDCKESWNLQQQNDPKRRRFDYIFVPDDPYDSDNVMIEEWELQMLWEHNF